MCEHSYWHESPRTLSYQQFRDIVDQFPRLRWIGLTGIGESYLNKDFPHMLEFCAKKKIWVEIFDLFYLIGEPEARLLIELGTEQVWCSMDGATPKTYNKIRVGSDFDKVLNNIKTFVRLKKANGSFFPSLDFHFIVMRENFSEVIPYIELIAEISPGSKIMFTKMLHKYPEVEHLFMDIPEELSHQAKNRGEELGVPIIWNMNTGVNKPKMSQCTTWSMPFIFASGEVIPCCSNNEANNREYQKNTSLGNIFENNFAEIWWGKPYSRFREKIKNGRVPEPCQDCCLYHPQNGEGL